MSGFEDGFPYGSEPFLPDAVEQLYIESPAIGLVEFRKRIAQLAAGARLDEYANQMPNYRNKTSYRVDKKDLEARMEVLRAEARGQS